MDLRKIDVEKLDEEQKRFLFDYLEEQRRRKLEKKDNFKPNEGQAPVFKAFADPVIETILVLSGNGAGKTAMGSNLAMDSAKGFLRSEALFLPVPSRVIVVLDKPDKVATVWLPEIRKWYEVKETQLIKHGKPYVTEIRFENGSELLFFFHEQSEMSFESIEADVVIFDEPPPRHIFVALRRGGRKKGRKPKYVIIGTPIAAAWMRTELYEPWLAGDRPDIACFRFSTKVNEKNLSDGYIDSFSRYLTDKEKNIRLHGEFFDMDGLALAHLYREEVHVIEDLQWNEMWPCVIAIDPHGAKPHHAVLLGCDPDNNYVVIDEYKSKSFPRKWAGEVWDKWGAEGAYKIVNIICDSYGSAPGGGGDERKSFIQVINEVFEDHGWRARATSFDEKSDEEFINKIQEVLAIPTEPDNMDRHIPRLRFSTTVPQCIRDVRNAEWEKMRHHDVYKPKLAIANRDMLACIKYALATNLNFSSNTNKIIRGHMPKSFNRFEHSGRRRVQLNEQAIARYYDEEDDW